MIVNRRFENHEGGVRLDAALIRFAPSSSRPFVKDAIERGTILVNGRRAAKGLKLRGGESIDVIELWEACDNLVAPSGACPQPLFEDEALLAFDKPAGMPVQPLSCRETGTLMNGVVTRYPECRALGPSLIRLGDSPLMAGALHRIDADTSGLVLVARTAQAFEHVRAQFAAQTVTKTYLALVEGSIAVGGTLENDLAHDPTLPFCRMIDCHHNRLTMAQCARLKPLHAVTEYCPLTEFTVGCETRTLLKVTIRTGVTHQIRAQLALSGMHIINDRLYGAFAVENQLGHCLHALSVELTHPLSGAAMRIETPYPRWALEASDSKSML